MDLTDLARSRRMTRSFDAGRPVSDAELDALLVVAATAPSAGMTQGWDLVVLRTAAARERFWSLTRRHAAGGGPLPGSVAAPVPDDRWVAGMRTAPLLMVVLGDPAAYGQRYAAPDKRARAEAERDPGGAGAAPGADLPGAPAGARGSSPWWVVDPAMASVLVLLAAADAGLGACFFGVPPDRRDAVLAEVGAGGRVLVGVVAVGTPAPHPHGPPGPRSPHRPGRRTPRQVAHEGRLGVPLATGPEPS